MTTARWREPALILAGDTLALLLFVYIGQRDHDVVNQTNPLWGVLQTGLMFAVPWAASAVWVRAATLGPDSFRGWMSRSLLAWLVAAPLGLIVRSWLLGRAVVPFAFMLAAYAFGGLFVLGWRAALWAVVRLGQRRRQVTGS